MWARWEAGEQVGSPLRYCAPDLVRQMSPSEILHALYVDGEGIRYVPHGIQTEAMAECCIRQTPSAYAFLSNRLTANPELARMAVQGDFLNYFIAPKTSKDDPEILLTALVLAGDQVAQFVQNGVQDEVLGRALEVARQRIRRHAERRVAFATGALRPGPLKLLREHGVHFLKQFNDRIWAYEGDAHFQKLVKLSTFFE